MSCIYKYKGKDYTKEEFYSLVATTMVQPRTVPKYEKVLFPTGNTASKVEGHTTLEEFKKQKEDRIKELEKEREKYEKEGLALENLNLLEYNKELDSYNLKKYNPGKWEKPLEDAFIKGKNNALKKEKEYKLEILESIIQIEKNTRLEINTIKQELERVETEGFGALKPIYNFYENTVTNILINDIYGKDSEFVNYEFTFNNDKYERLNDKNQYLKNGKEITQKEFNSIQNSVTKQDKKEGKFTDKYYVNSNALITDEYGNTWNEVIIINTMANNILLNPKEIQQNNVEFLDILENTLVENINLNFEIENINNKIIENLIKNCL